MAHLQKHTKAACGHMFAHYDRSGSNISNESIDPERTHLNYNLAEHQQLPQGEFVRQRCSEVRCQNRKDVNVMCSWVVTAPERVPDEDLEKFFRETYDFLSARYGKENVVSAYVHMDETTPHLHFAFVPVVHDKEKGLDKVSAKLCISKGELQRFHPELESHLAAAMGYEVGILNDATKEGNKSIEELKRGTAQKDLERIIDHYNELDTLISEKNANLGKLERLEGKRQELAAENRRLKAENRTLRVENNKRAAIPESEYNDFLENREEYQKAEEKLAAAKKFWAKTEEYYEELQQEKSRMQQEKEQAKQVYIQLKRDVAAFKEREETKQLEILSRAADMADAKSKCRMAFIQQKGLEEEYEAYERMMMPKKVKSKGMER